MENNLKKIAVFTSGGDAPGMNAAIRAVVRSGIYYDLDVVGISKGYDGMIKNKFTKLNVRSVSNTIQRGGTFLKSARSKQFRTEEGRKKAFENLKKNSIDAIVAIGGDGTFTGAHIFHEEYGIPVVGVPATIDNDLSGTDHTIGFDTATNTAVEAIDKIKDTASAHDRLFFIEVMGRDSGFIAVNAGISGGAIATIIPEVEMTVDRLIARLQKSGKRNKSSSVVIVAEGGKNGGAFALAEEVKKKIDYFDTRVTILGHLQRGGAPTSFDRVLASRLGVAAVEGLLAGHHDTMAGMIQNEIKYTPIKDAIKQKNKIDMEAFRVAKILSI
jgi:6-phosphofructokinase 1